jgi:hypothetical protein
MSSTKRILGDYTIQSINPTDKVNINTSLVTINGNLLVTGSQTSLNTTNTSIYDNIITLNAGTSPGSPPVLDAGLLVDRGMQANVELRWHESVQRWQITNDGTTYANIATTSATGNIDITGFSLYDTANTVTFYTGTVSSGKSGVFVDNTIGTQQELATKSAAIAYSIIFG